MAFSLYAMAGGDTINTTSAKSFGFHCIEYYIRFSCTVRLLRCCLLTICYLISFRERWSVNILSFEMQSLPPINNNHVQKHLLQDIIDQNVQKVRIWRNARITSVKIHRKNACAIALIFRQTINNKDLNTILNYIKCIHWRKCFDRIHFR